MGRRPETFGARLRKARLAAGLSQSELAARCGMSKPTLSRYENDHVLPALTTLERIAAAMGIGVSELVTSREDERRLYAALRERGIEISSDLEARQLADDIAEIRSEGSSKRGKRA